MDSEISPKSVDVTEFFISEDLDVNMKDDRGSTSLHYAVRMGAKVEVIEALISKGANINAKDDKGYIPLHWAVQGGDEVFNDSEAKTFDRLLHWVVRGDMKDDDRFRVGDIDVIKLVSKGINVNERTHDGRTALHMAAVGGDINVIKLLISKGADLETKDDDGDTSLHWAAGSGNTDVVKFLVSQGADVNVKNNRDRTPLDLAAAGRHDAVVEYLSRIARETVSKLTVKQQEKADEYIRQYGSGVILYYLSEVSRHKDEDVVLKYVKYFVSKGADVHAKDGNGLTPINLAKDRKDWVVVEFLTDLK